jgi:hypothetical protein
MKKIKVNKAIYSVCAFYHEEMNIFAVSLIDKELKVYKIKQNGARM